MAMNALTKFKARNPSPHTQHHNATRDRPPCQSHWWRYTDRAVLIKANSGTRNDCRPKNQGPCPQR